MCDLCDLINKGRNPLKNIEFGRFLYEPECADPACAMPMLILKEHRVDLTFVERVQLGMIVELHFPDLRLRGIGMRKIKEHWHEHLCLKE